MQLIILNKGVRAILGNDHDRLLVDTSSLPVRVDRIASHRRVARTARFIVASLLGSDLQLRMSSVVSKPTMGGKVR
jgi:hypothetical protein